MAKGITFPAKCLGKLSLKNTLAFKTSPAGLQYLSLVYQFQHAEQYILRFLGQLFKIRPQSIGSDSFSSSLGMNRSRIHSCLEDLWKHSWWTTPPLTANLCWKYDLKNKNKHVGTEFQSRFRYSS